VHELFSKFPKVSLGFYPTPLHKLETLSQETGVNLYIKREDFSGVSLFGGNKIRKLELYSGRCESGRGRIRIHTTAQLNPITPWRPAGPAAAAA
jgi:hypothetical protein